MADAGIAGMNVNRSEESGENNQNYAAQGDGGVRPSSGPQVQLHPHVEVQ
jgi:hypothetical protein